MTNKELEAIIQNPLSTPEQRSDAEKLLNNNTSGFDPSRVMLAEWFRTFDEPQRHESFEKARKGTNAPEYSEAEEAKPAKPAWLKAFHRDTDAANKVGPV